MDSMDSKFKPSKRIMRVLTLKLQGKHTKKDARLYHYALTRYEGNASLNDGLKS